MINKGRVFGQNMYYYMMRNGLTPEILAERLGYTVQEIKKIFDARLFIDKNEKDIIANTLHVSIEDLTDTQKVLPHDDSSFIEYRGDFSDEGNKEKILDLFDMYCDVQELLIREGLKPSL